VRRFDSVEAMLLNLRAKWSLNDSFEVIGRNWEKYHGQLSIVNWSVFESVEVVNVCQILLYLLVEIETSSVLIISILNKL